MGINFIKEKMLSNIGNMNSMNSVWKHQFKRNGEIKEFRAQRKIIFYKAQIWVIKSTNKLIILI